MTKVLVLGATGRTGKLIIEELAKNQSLQIIAAIRKANDISRLPKIERKIKTHLVDIENAESIEKAIEQVDIIVHAIRLRGNIPENALVELDKRIRQAIPPTKEIPMIIVGGAGSLKMNSGKYFWEDPHFPTQTLPRGRAHAQLRIYLEEHSFKDKWAYLVPPPAYIPEGIRLGTYKQAELDLEEDFLNEQISYSDFAIAISDAVREEWQGVHLIASST
ncbi:NAD(P)-dependent oxidoreductase [Streptococcus oricebi]|uniref:Saccharopine dehydrogenase n=1 Tax=Streptococcus oricebi TaxID=1547447 RepID=A0ABS5B4V7_9STRE|nr:NAD(P)H-binding protein [Streptococcus oricebi]MBP2623780.1 saccharopine dehydrogenase [Streptococcus oricebi]